MLIFQLFRHIENGISPTTYQFTVIGILFSLTYIVYILLKQYFSNELDQVFVLIYSPSTAKDSLKAQISDVIIAKRWFYLLIAGVWIGLSVNRYPLKLINIPGYNLLTFLIDLPFFIVLITFI